MGEYDTCQCVICGRREADYGYTCRSEPPKLANLLTELVDLYALLPHAVAPGSGSGEPRVSGTPEPSVPVNLVAVDMLLRPEWAGSVADTSVPAMTTVVERVRAIRAGVEFVPNGDGPAVPVPTVVEEVQQVHRRVPVMGMFGPLWTSAGDQDGEVPVLPALRSWCEAVRDVTGGRWGVPHDVAGAASILHTRADWLCQYFEPVGDLAAEVLTMVCVMRSQLHLSRRVTYLPDPCPKCSLLALRRAQHNPRYSECVGCGALVSDRELDEASGVSAA